jgi:hypothetical protein
LFVRRRQGNIIEHRVSNIEHQDKILDQTARTINTGIG